MAKFKKNCCYVLKNDFFKRVNESRFPSNKNGRPVMCCCRDKKNHSIFWVIPLTTKVDKVTEIIKKEGGNKKCFKYMLYKKLRNTAFNIQDTFPVIEKYIDHEFVYSNKKLEIQDKEIIDELRKKMKIVLFKQMTNTVSWDSINIKEIFKMMSDELKLKKRIHTKNFKIGIRKKEKLISKNKKFNYIKNIN